MSNQSGPSRFEALFESALRDYEEQTGDSLAKHPLAERFQKCQSVDSITILLQEKARAFREYRGRDKITNSLKSVVSVLHRVSAVTAAGHSIGMSIPPAHAIHTGLGILLTAFKGVMDDLDTLVDLLESIELFLNRLNIYTKTPTPAMTEIVVKILVELLSIFALVTKQIRQGRLGRTKRLVKKLFGENYVQKVLQRLDRLTQEEARMATAQTLDVVNGLSLDMEKVIRVGEAYELSVRSAPTDNNELVPQPTRRVEATHEMANEMKTLKGDTLRDIQNWLSPPDTWKSHNLARSSRHTGTAAWFVGGTIFSEWKSSSQSSHLWIHGKPGAGKSVLCSTIIENIGSMRNLGLASLAFYYCDFREEEKRGLRGMLTSMLVQLCHQSESYHQILIDFYSEHANGSQHPSDDELELCLKNMLQAPGQAPVYLIVDGLDECSNTSDIPSPWSPREKVLKLFKDLVSLHLPNLRICVTSRFEIDISVAFEPLAFRSVSLHNENEHRKYIENYIRTFVNTDPKMQRWKAADKELVIDMLIKNSDGMFRWVYCQIAYLRRCPPGHVRLALDELPEDLDGTYDRALREIDEANWELAYRLLQCVAVASRPLRVVELAEILSFDFEMGSIPKYRANWRQENPLEAVLSTMTSLLAIVEHLGSRVVQFPDPSVKEYLTSFRLAESNDVICRRYHIFMTHAHTLAAQACLGTLLRLDENVVNGDNLERYPLAEYAAKHWVDHARFEGVSGSIEDGMQRLFDPSKLHLAIWVWIYDPILSWLDESRKSKTLFQHRGSPLHYAAISGLHSIVEFLVVQHQQDVHSRAFDDKSTPLHLAARRGHQDVVDILLQHGADSAAQNKDGWIPLHLASRNGYEEAASSLLYHGGGTTARTKAGWTPLHLASRNEQEEIVRLLLQHSADTEAPTNDGRTPLHMVSELGHEKVARLLLKHNADTTAKNKDGWTPLHLASERGHGNVARLLLEHRADTTSQIKDGWTPLHLASRHGHDEVTRSLLDQGADTEAKKNDGWTPLHFASLNDHDKVAFLLLKHGADTKAQNKDGWTPLHMASERGHEKVTRLLLKQNADTTARNNEGWTSLHLASECGHENVARLLLEHCASTTAQFMSGWTPLHLVSRNGHDKVARILLEHGADATAENEDGLTPLHLMMQSGHKDITRLLLEHGADATAKDKNGWTPFHLASINGHEDIARLLLEHGADTTARTTDGRTLLHLASEHGHEQVARLLLEHGVDKTAQNQNGRTPLHLASQNGHDNVVRLLIERGVDTAVQNNDGRTPLHLASQNGHEQVARLLLEHDGDTTVRNNDGRTPLHLASRNGHVKVARSLLEHGADAMAQAEDGRTPLDLALERGHQEVTCLLLNHHTGPTALTMDGQPPVHLTVTKWRQTGNPAQ